MVHQLLQAHRHRKPANLQSISNDLRYTRLTSNRESIIVGSTVAVFVCLSIAVLAFWFRYRRRGRRGTLVAHKKVTSPDGPVILSNQPVTSDTARITPYEKAMVEDTTPHIQAGPQDNVRRRKLQQQRDQTNFVGQYEDVIVNNTDTLDINLSFEGMEPFNDTICGEVRQ